MKWIGSTQQIWDSVRIQGLHGLTVDSKIILNGNQFNQFVAVNDINPMYQLGSSSSECLQIQAIYESGAQGLDQARFITKTAGSSAGDGMFAFYVDEVEMFHIVDDGINLVASKNLSIGGVDILTDSSGTTTLNNIDALDATTEGTIESAIDTLVNLTSIGRGSATTNFLAGDVTIYNAVNDGNPQFRIGSALAESGFMQAVYDSGAQTLDYLEIGTATADSGSNAGSIKFKVDGTVTTTIDDGGIDLGTGYGISINGTDILTDAEGTATLNNIDALDATTATTIFSGSKTTDGFTLTSANADDPVVIIQNTTDDNQAARLQFFKNRGAAGQDNDNIGEIDFYGYNDAGTPESQQYAKVTTKINDATDGEESGQLGLYVASHNGSMRQMILGTGGSESNEVDVTIANGANSVTTLEGTLTMGSTATLDNSGLLQVANQSNITGVGTISSGTWQGTAIASAYLDADTVHYSAQRQMTYYMFRADIDTTKTYIGLQEADGESTSATNKNLPILAPVAGKLLKVFLRANSNLSGNTLTWRLETRASSASTSGSPTVVGTQSGAGCTASSMTTYDFTTSLDSTVIHRK